MATGQKNYCARSNSLARCEKFASPPLLGRGCDQPLTPVWERDSINFDEARKVVSLRAAIVWEKSKILLGSSVENAKQSRDFQPLIAGNFSAQKLINDN